MTFFHYQFLNLYYYNIPLSSLDEAIGWVARFLFLFLFGFHYKAYQSKFAVKFRRLFVCALTVSLASYLFNPDFVIIFGVLHFFALCVLMFRLPKLLLNTIGVLALLVFIKKLPALKHNYLLFVGFHNYSFQSFDYFPVLPFFSIVWFGMIASDISERYDLLKKTNVFVNIRFIRYLSSRSLEYYLLHLPIILLVHYMLR